MTSLVWSVGRRVGRFAAYVVNRRLGSYGSPRRVRAGSSSRRRSPDGTRDRRHGNPCGARRTVGRDGRVAARRRQSATWSRSSKQINGTQSSRGRGSVIDVGSRCGRCDQVSARTLIASGSASGVDRTTGIENDRDRPRTDASVGSSCRCSMRGRDGVALDHGRECGRLERARAARARSAWLDGQPVVRRRR